MEGWGEGGREGGSEGVRERESESVNVTMTTNTKSQAASELPDRSERKQGMCYGSLFCLLCS